MDEATFARLESRLDAIVRLLAAPMTEGKTIAESAPMLSRLGLENSLIATICGTDTAVVRTAIWRTAQSKGGRPGKVRNGRSQRAD